MPEEKQEQKMFMFDVIKYHYSIYWVEIKMLNPLTPKNA